MQAVELLCRGHNVPAAHAAMMRAAPEAEVIAAGLGGVKLSIPGLSAAKAAAKRRGKI